MKEHQYAWTPTHEQAVQEAVAIAQNFPDAKGFLIIDIDDVRDSTRQRMWEKLYRWVGLTAPHLRERRPTFEDAETKGLKASFVEILGVETYDRIWKAIERRDRHFQNVPLVHEGMPEFLCEIQQAGFIPILWLTARNAGMTEVSRQEGIRQGLPDMPVFAMYPGAGNHVTTMKLEVIQAVAEAVGKPVIMIDDNPFLIRALDQGVLTNAFGIQYDTPRYPEVVCQRRATWPTMGSVLASL